MSDNIETAVLGGGCFWCTEAIYKEIEGVKSVDSGYSGGTKDNPSYEEVCTGNTGHAEVVKIEYDPSMISYDGILEIFFAAHDPTTLNRQGNDIGTQYRSVIFYLDENQKEKAESIIKRLTEEKAYKRPIVTAVEKFSEFFSSEGYHKNYFETNPESSYCRLVISPKLEKFKKSHVPLLRR